MVYNIGNLSYVTHGSILMHISFIAPPGDNDYIMIEIPSMLDGKHIRQVSDHVFDPDYNIEAELHLEHTFDSALQIRNYPIYSLIINEGIAVIGVGAFKNLRINEVFWVESCKHIPANCFSGSHVGRLRRQRFALAKRKAPVRELRTADKRSKKTAPVYH